MLTGTLGTAQAQPGNLQPGYFCTGYAEWRGPFPLAEVGGYALTPGEPIKAVAGTVSVPPAVASQMAVSDASWWVFH